jgi:AraC-like DNA-binding protein
MLESPPFLRDRPDMNDPLSDMLTLVEARSVLSGRLHASGAWAVRFPPPEKIKFSALLRGTCWLTLEGLPAPARLEAGDVIVVNGQRSFMVASDPAVDPIDARALFREAPGNVARIGTGNDVFLFGGHVTLDAAHASLVMDVLPPLIHVRSVTPEAGALRWLLEQLVVELSSSRPGSDLAASHLAQLMFVQVLRAHLAETAQSSDAGWIRALADERIAPALRLMHSDPSHAWTLSELARASAMSRTTFAARFKEVSGMAPVAYLLGWRMRLAERALLNGDGPISSVALSVGYTSESAFSNAFKRMVGVSPKRYRSARLLNSGRQGLS